MTPDFAVFDGHNDFLLRLQREPARREEIFLQRGASGHLDLPRMREGGFAGGLFAIFVPSPATPGTPSLEEITRNPPYDSALPAALSPQAAQPVALQAAAQMLWMERAAPDDFAICRNVAEIRAAMARGAIAGVMHMEGAEAIDPGLDALHVFHALGLRSLGPVWSRPTAFGHGVPFRFPGDPDTGPGLTPQGKALVRECNRLGILIDLSHLNGKGFDDVARISEAPLVATHSNVHALCPSPRNLTDRQLDRIAESGGMVGLNFATIFLRPDGRRAADCGLEPMLRHLDYLIGRLGEDHVGFGSDFDGCTVPDAIGDVTGLPHLISALQGHGFDKMLLDKLTCDNWVALLERVIG
ncbi:MAG: dipeptidase [Tropicimonas sp.]|uniref:dipeptidase n=1 Tax=Tropicimonas sp. TaxID=2067044 RepID=UPI003A854254